MLNEVIQKLSNMSESSEEESIQNYSNQPSFNE